MFFDYSKKRGLCKKISRAYRDRVFKEVKSLAQSGKIEDYEHHRETGTIFDELEATAPKDYTPEVDFLYHCCTRIHKYRELARSWKAVLLSVDGLEKKLAHVPNERPHLKKKPELQKIHPLLEEKFQKIESSEMVIG